MAHKFPQRAIPGTELKTDPKTRITTRVETKHSAGVKVDPSVLGAVNLSRPDPGVHLPSYPGRPLPGASTPATRPIVTHQVVTPGAVTPSTGTATTPGDDWTSRFNQITGLINGVSTGLDNITGTPVAAKSSASTADNTLLYGGIAVLVVGLYLLNQ